MLSRVLIILAIFGSTSAGATWLSRPEPTVPRTGLSQLADRIDGWTGKDVQLDAKVLDTLGLDDHVNRIYAPQNGAPPVSLYIGFYKSQRTGQTIHSPLKCLPGTGWQPLETGLRTVDVIDAHGQAQRIQINRYVVQKGLERHIVMFWYQMRGHVVSSEYVAKLYLIDGAVRTNRTDGALVRVIVPVPDGASDAPSEASATEFVQKLFPRLESHLPA